jgi:peptidyl-prolyl cis-trans isomerase B (cyclophilin B)
MKTSAGDITVVLYDDTPIHRDNFIKLVNEKFYDGTLFHRVIPQFMIQAGDPGSKDAKPGVQLGSGGPGYTIPAEMKPNHYHKKGVLAAARQGDQVNPKRASSGSQFYIVVGQPIPVASLNQMEQSGQHPKFTEEQRKVYSTTGGTPHLDYQYTVFGEVTEGLDIVDKISKVACDQGNRPTADVKIISIQTVK